MSKFVDKKEKCARIQEVLAFCNVDKITNSEALERIQEILKLAENQEEADGNNEG